jgi:hypothetical protein
MAPEDLKTTIGWKMLREMLCFNSGAVPLQGESVLASGGGNPELS